MLLLQCDTCQSYINDTGAWQARADIDDRIASTDIADSDRASPVFVSEAGLWDVDNMCALLAAKLLMLPNDSGPFVGLERCLRG